MAREPAGPVQTEDQPPLVSPEAPLHAALCVVGNGESPPPSPGTVLLEEAFSIGRGGAAHLDAKGWLVSDKTVSRQHAVIEHDGGWCIRDLGSRNGILVDGGILRDGIARLRNGSVVVVGGHVAIFRRMTRAQHAAVAAEHAHPLGPVATASPTMALTMTRLRALARTDRPLLFAGETGTGKEVYARAAHELSGRTGPFVAINCAAFQPDLLASELFGYKRGSHSQATEDHAGIIAAAEGGTLFLDEIGEMSHSAQAKLLRFLQDKSYQSLGSARARRADVRIAAATQNPFRTLRPDVLGRFGSEPLLLPPLRRRREDLGALTRHFLRLGADGGDGEPLTLEPSAFLALCFHAWRRNVRELEAALSEATLLARDRGAARIRLHDLPSGLRKAMPGVPQAAARAEDSAPLAATAPAHAPKPRTRRQRPSRDELERLLQTHSGDVPELARAFGRHREQVWRWCKDYELNPERYRA
jgi:transcriptional regulator with PAS, ATPase and Fis domain